MTFVHFLLGMIPPALGGWILLDVLQYKRRVLTYLEQSAAAVVIGLHAHMLFVFMAHTYLGIPLTLAGFLGVQTAVIAALAIGRFALGKPAGQAMVTPSSPPSRPVKIALGILLAWVIIKAVITGTTFLLLTPTYLDDTLDNWNLRGKVFYEDQALTLAMPSEDPLLSPLGVSSYPPSVPLMKTWLATVHGAWTDPLVNGLHFVWYAAALVLIYSAVRRRASIAWALFGAYLAGSMPLYLMHGTNPYGDAFVSVHVFLAVSMLFFALTETDINARVSFIRIGALCAGLLPFVKNEGLLVYLPPVLLLLALGLWVNMRHGRISRREGTAAIIWYGGSTLLLGLPWLIFKWMNGLTFGNAKPFTDLGIGWQEGIVKAITVNTLMEGNWLLLFPLLLIVLVWQRRAAFGMYIPVTAFFLIVFGGQMMLFLFTGLSIEAKLQTGLARGVVQQLPVIVFLTTLLLAQGEPALRGAAKALADSGKKMLV